MTDTLSGHQAELLIKRWMEVQGFEVDHRGGATALHRMVDREGNPVIGKNDKQQVYSKSRDVFTCIDLQGQREWDRPCFWMVQVTTEKQIHPHKEKMRGHRWPLCAIEEGIIRVSIATHSAPTIISLRDVTVEDRTWDFTKPIPMEFDPKSLRRPRKKSLTKKEKEEVNKAVRAKWNQKGESSS